MAEVWVVSTTKGGVLKTSVTTNIAGILSLTKKVLIVDVDPQGNGLLTFGLNPDRIKMTIYELMIRKITDPRKAIIKAQKNLDVIPSNDELGELEFDVIPDRIKFPDPLALLRDALKPIMHYYDYIIIDTPASGLTQANALAMADKVIIPYQPESYSLRSLIKILKRIEMIKKHSNPKLEIMGVVGTLVDIRTNLHSELMQEARKFCLNHDLKIFDTVIPRSIRFASSVAYNRLPATLVEPENDIVKNYFTLLSEMLGEDENIGQKHG